MQSQQSTFHNSHSSGNIVCFNYHQHISLQCDAYKNVKPCLFGTSVYYGIIQKAFSQGNFPMCYLPSANFPNVQFPKRQLPKAQVRPSTTALGGGQSGAARKGLGSGRLEHCTFRSLPLGKIPLGSCHLGKYITSMKECESPGCSL